MSKLLLIDGSNYLFRAFHALPPLSTSRGEPTGAIKGFNGMLKNVFESEKPDYAACVFDAPGRNFRHDIYADYKANRPPMPEDLRAQIEPIFELVRLKGWPLLQVPGVEADDVLATLARQGEKAGMEVVIATGDKDMAQLVNEHVCLLNTMTHQRFDRQGVFEKYGVWPEQIIDYLSLMGDKVDNVPGIEKCGPKTAAKWLAQYGSLDAIVANADAIKGKIGEYLRQGLPFLPTARKLVTINTAAAVDKKPEELILTAADDDALQAFYVRWEMRQGAKRKAATPAKEHKPEPVAAQTADLFEALQCPTDVSGEAVQTAQLNASVRIVRERQALQALADDLHNAATQALPVSVVVLSDRQQPMSDTAAGVAFCSHPLQACYVPLGHAEGQNAALEDVQTLLGPWFASQAPKVFHDAKQAMHVLKNMAIDVGGLPEDAMLMSYVLEAHLKHDITKIAARTLSSGQPDWDDLLGKGKSRVPAATLSIEAAAGEMTRMAAVLRAASSVMRVRLSADAGLERIYRQVELPTMRVLFEMERTGVLLDVARLAEQSRELTQAIDQLTESITEAAGEAFNPSSPKQLAHILFEKLGLPSKKKTSSGTPSTDEEVLSELALDYPLPKLVLQYRSLTKLKSTYTDKLPQMVHAADGRVHTTFGQATAVTGRLSSFEPNLQNIPVRTAEGRRVREAFIAKEGARIVSADYSQVELRIMAHISGDAGLIEAFAKGRDIHRATAAEVFGVTLEAVTDEQRRMAKVINFGLIYGMSAFGLAQNLGLERSVAAHYIDTYFARYPGVRAYMQRTRERVKTQGYVETAFGRRLWLPDIASTRANVRAAAERAAINAPMQGTAADLIKIAMIAVADWIKTEQLQTRLLLQVHDELILEVPEAELALVERKLPELMAAAGQLSVPLIAQVGVGDSWEAAH